MSAREWQPGDVAVIEWRGVNGDRSERAIRGKGGWSLGDMHSWLGDAHVTSIRPLAVIDPEDREQVERLAIAYTLRHNYSGTPWQEREQHNRDLVIDSLSDALCEFANPTPPKPDEPLGLGAVVEDAEGERWVRMSPRIADFDWFNAVDHSRTRPWRTLNAVKVLSAGVES